MQETLEAQLTAVLAKLSLIDEERARLVAARDELRTKLITINQLAASAAATENA